MSVEHYSRSPLWIEYSGLPELLNSKIRGGAGWSVFKKVMELDCEINAVPEAVEISLSELGRRTGHEPSAVRKSVLTMRKLGVMAHFLPESDEEAALLKVKVPLTTPVALEQIKADWPILFGDPNQKFRYSEIDLAEPAESHDPILQEIVDMYFNTVGLKMNSFVLDELRLIRERYPADIIRKTFRRAQQNEIHSLNWVVRELIRLKKKDEEKGTDLE